MKRRQFIRNTLSAAVAASLPLGSAWSSLRHSPTRVAERQFPEWGGRPTNAGTGRGSGVE